jgi:hypothetical protein
MRYAITILCACALLPAAPALAKKPSLRVTGVRATSYAHAGGTLAVRVTVAGGRSAKARVYLSADRRRSKDDVALPGAVRVRRTSGTLVAQLPASLPAGTRYVLACVNRSCAVAKGRLTITAAADPAKTSQALIDADLKAGKLSAEKALTYRVYAVIGDDRLPAPYAGDASADEDDGVMREVADQWPKLSKATRRALAPDLAPPPLREGKAPRKRKARASDDEPSEGSCVIDGYKAMTWKSVTAAGGKVRINWDPMHPEDAQNVNQLAADITTAYARFTQIMGREPLSDFKSSCWHGKDSALDIYLDQGLRGAAGITVPVEMRTRYTPDCDRAASFIIARPRSVDFTERFVVAHELFHAFQNAFVEHKGCQEYKWFDEGAANWAAHSAFPTDDTEHYFTALMTDPGFGLDYRDYASWPFVLWMEKTFGERSIRATYEQFGTAASLPAIDAAIGGFRAHWLDFAKNAWNQEPVPTFKDWDRYTAAPRIDSVHLFLAGQHSRPANVPADVGERGRAYHPFAVTDDKIRELVWRNPLSGDPDFRVGAILTLANGQTRFDDWSGKERVSYCRDKPEEDIASMVVVYANSSLLPHGQYHRVQGNPELGLRDSCDGLPWHFKVLNATLQTHAIGGKTGSDDQLCGSLAGLPIHGQTDFTAARADDDFSLDHDVKANSFGALIGEISVRAPAKFSYTENGCQGLDSGGAIVPCSKAFDRFAGGDGNWSIGFSIDAASKDAGTATLTWALSAPEIGFVDFTDDVCNVQDIWHPLTPGKNKQEVPLATFAGTDLFALTLKGNEQYSEDSYGRPATLAYDWTYVMTLQRVDENGNPL